MKQISNLQTRRTPADGSPLYPAPSGQMARRTPRPQPDSTGGPGSTPTGASPRFAKNAAGPTTTHGSARPPGQMVRGPTQFRAPRNPTVGSMRGGPNLRGRDGKPGQDQRRGGSGGGGGSGPKRRDKVKSSAESAPPKTAAETDLADTLSDGMIHHLMRIQRKEWDRTPYEPKYAKGSFAANELIHAGRELFKGESPPVKIWGPLEKRIGVVGMFGAEARLKIRREKDGDAEPFGQEILETEEPEEAQVVKKETSTVQ